MARESVIIITGDNTPDDAIAELNHFSGSGPQPHRVNDMEDLRALERKGMMSKEFVDELQEAIGREPNESPAASLQGKFEKLPFFNPPNRDTPKHRKLAPTKNQRKRRRKAQKKSRRMQRA